jgi:formylglycine-generating enzyme required for sulfatase activity
MLVGVAYGDKFMQTPAAALRRQTIVDPGWSIPPGPTRPSSPPRDRLGYADPKEPSRVRDMPSAAALHPPGAAPRPFRIFLASPADVAHERAIVGEVVGQIGMERRFRDRLALQLIGWDRPGQAVAMPAGENPQVAIDRGLPRPADCDLVITLFWSRRGTPLPAEQRRPDGSRYRSATEWEYHNALDGFHARGRPVVWLFRRLEPPDLPLDAPDLVARQSEWQAVTDFFAAQTHSPDGSIAAGINTYRRPEDFRLLFERLLRDHLESVLAALDQAVDPVGVAPDPPAADAATPLYTGEPYPGLAAFTPEQAPIFFGRGGEVDQLLALFADGRTRFAALVGASGAGKSSLVAAGLIPRLRAGVIGAAPWVDCRFTPAERGRDPFLALAMALRSRLPAEPRTDADWARDLRTEPECLAQTAAALLAGRPAGAEVLLFVDQLEELFVQTDPALTAPFVDLLGHAAGTERVRVLATLRADFYAAACTNPGLAALLRRDRGSVPLDPPGRVAMAAMIVGPARAVGLDLEAGLADRILEDAGGSAAGPGALALTAFALAELYQLSRAAGCLTLTGYAAVGGIEGAVRRCAETTLARLAPVPAGALGQLFEHLVEVDERETAARRRAALADLPAAARPLAAALTGARLLTAGRGADDAATLELAHESLLRAWPDLAAWVRDHAEALRARRDLERAATEWQAAGRPGSALRTGALLKRYRAAPPPRSVLAGAYLSACTGRQRRGRALAAAGLVLFAAGGYVLNYVNGSKGYTPGLMLRALAVELGLGRLPGPFCILHEPHMEKIEGGSFRMGEEGGESYDDERPVHERTIAPFWLGSTEVTFDDYDLFAAATGRDRPGDEGWGRSQRPVINVSWEDARDYAAWLARVTGRPYRLPSEAEWEYAARAGTTVPRWYEETVGPNAEPCRFMNGQDQSLERSPFYSDGAKKALATQDFWKPFDCDDGFVNTAPVGSFVPNPWGLYDMLGNVWEWVADCSYGYSDASVDGRAVQGDGEDKGKKCAARVLRGGSWNNHARDLRAAVRLGLAPDYRDNYLGLRLARSL